MRKISSILVSGIAFLMLDACVREPIPPVEESRAITATIAADGPQTRFLRWCEEP